MNELTCISPEMTDAIMYRVMPVGTTVDPCAGQGDIIKRVRVYYPDSQAWDRQERGFPLDRVTDFLTEGERFDTIITQPPHSEHVQYLQHALRVAGQKVIMLLDMEAEQQRAFAPLLGNRRLPLAEVYELKDYPPDGQARYGWFVFDRQYLRTQPYRATIDVAEPSTTEDEFLARELTKQGFGLPDGNSLISKQPVSGFPVFRPDSPRLSDEDLEALAGIDERAKVLGARIQQLADPECDQCGVFIFGPGGHGKTTAVDTVLNREIGEDNWQLHAGDISAPGIIEKLQEFSHSVHVLRDLEKSFKDNSLQAVLRAAMDTPIGGRRRIRDTKHGKQAAFDFNGAIVIESNETIDHRFGPLGAVASRTHPFFWSLSDKELAAMMRKIACGGYKRLTPDQCMEVAEFVIQEMERKTVEATITGSSCPSSLPRNPAPRAEQESFHRRTWATHRKRNPSLVRQVQRDHRCACSSSLTAAHNGASVPCRQSRRSGWVGSDSRSRKPEHDCPLHEAHTGSVGGGGGAAELLTQEENRIVPGFISPQERQNFHRCFFVQYRRTILKKVGAGLLFPAPLPP